MDWVKFDEIHNFVKSKFVFKYPADAMRFLGTFSIYSVERLESKLDNINSSLKEIANEIKRSHTKPAIGPR